MKNNTVSMEKFISDNGYIPIRPSGRSMRPLISPLRDVCLISRKNTIKKHDIVWYKNLQGKDVLHRIMAVNGDDTYSLCGDNQTVFEKGIKNSDILGVMEGFYHNGKYIDCKNDKKYKIYTAIWCFMPLRKTVLFIYENTVRKMKRKKGRHEF